MMDLFVVAHSPQRYFCMLNEDKNHAPLHIACIWYFEQKTQGAEGGRGRRERAFVWNRLKLCDK